MHCNVCMFEGDVSAKAYYVKYIELFHFILGIDVSSMFGKRRNYLSDTADIRGISKSSGCVYNYIHQVIDAICTTLLRIWTFPLLRNSTEEHQQNSSVILPVYSMCVVLLLIGWNCINSHFTILVYKPVQSNLITIMKIAGFYKWLNFF